MSFITSIEDGWVEWLSAEGEHGTTQLKGLRLVHQLTEVEEYLRDMAVNMTGTANFRLTRAFVEGLSLERFLGSDGLIFVVALIFSRQVKCRKVIFWN